ncbi:UDP-2,3-diacylglucosamine hydrolase [Campylobacterota bacterium]|nr:UDP-2,3-diacylglucosamine hydrolase [Campylobacterota bacterium]
MHLDFANAAEIKSGAVFLADAHFNPLIRKEVLAFFDAVAQGKIAVKQMFLLGDIADCLFGFFKFSRERNREIIDAIDRAAKSGVEIWYFEGNHDFTLKNVFCKEVKIVKKGDQPAPFNFCGLRTLLLHGDYNVGFGYALYTAIVRNRAVLFAANIALFNFCGNWVLKYVEKMLSKKRLDYKIDDYAKKRSQRIAKLLSNADIVIEGHFHQNCRFYSHGAEYQNVGAFACKASFIRLEWSEKRAVFQNERL